ncbi:unnamed protein product [Sphagnum troendelagicum]
MAAGHEVWDQQSEYRDTSPLLMATPASGHHQHVVNIPPISSLDVPSSPPGGETAGGETLSRNLSPSSSLQAQASFTSNSASSLSPGSSNSYGTRHRASHLISGIWITFEVVVTVSQIIASIIVLFVSRDEKPEAPLAAWIAGYAAGCLVSLPLLYWRYKYRNVRSREQDALAPPLTSSPTTPTGAAEQTSYLSMTPEQQDEESQAERQRSLNGNVTGWDRVGMLMERFKIAVDCFFAVWFVLGTVWVFGGHSSSSEAPNLYRLCIVFLTFSCVGYAMPFILCATICCCLPCIISFLGREDSTQVRGASAEAIAALPTYKFKLKGANNTKVNKEESESDSEGIGEGGLVAAGTEKERLVSPEDAVCCICLGKYKDDVELRELPCTHYFHVECVDKWLVINASCPLCKHDVVESTETDGATPGETGHESTDRLETPQPGAPLN